LLSLKEILKDKSKWREDSPDNPPCAKCDKIIDDDVPIRMWLEDGELEISFHWDCLSDEDKIFLHEVLL
jgi:hypothetical protein